MAARQITDAEATDLRARVEKAWAWSGYYFHPLMPTTRKDVLAFKDDALEALLPDQEFRRLLAEIGVEQIKWWCEHDPSEELALSTFPGFYGYSESFIVDDTLEWIVYWSHEQTITFGGARLISAVTSRIPNWEIAEWGANAL